MTDFINSLKWRYAVKKYDASKTVSAQDLEQLKEAVRLSASSVGLQPYHIFIIQSQEVKQQLVDLIKQHQHQDVWILLIAPTQLPYKEWASHYQLSLQNVLVVHHKQIKDLPETLRQALTSPSCKVVINFANQLEQSELEKYRKLAVTNNIWFYQYEQLTQNGFTH